MIPPIKRSKDEKGRPYYPATTTDAVLDEYKNSLTDLLRKMKRSDREAIQATRAAVEQINEAVTQSSRTQTAENDGTEEEVAVTFSQIMAGKTYRVEFTDLSWWEDGASYILIGYYEGEDYTQLTAITTEPEDPVEVTIPEDANPDSLEVKIGGACSTQINLIDITETQGTMTDLTVPDAGLDQEQIDNILHNLGLDVIIQDFEDRISALENAQ